MVDAKVKFEDRRILAILVKGKMACSIVSAICPGLGQIQIHLTNTGVSNDVAIYFGIINISCSFTDAIGVVGVSHIIIGIICQKANLTVRRADCILHRGKVSC